MIPMYKILMIRMANNIPINDKPKIVSVLGLAEV